MKLLFASLALSSLFGCQVAEQPAGFNNPGVTRVQVDVRKQRHAISPLIYGLNYASTQQILDLRAPLNRSGGDSADIYDFQSDARASGRDWYFESFPADRTNTMGQYSDGFVVLSHQGGADAMITVPMVGWVPRLGPGRTPLAGFSITKYGLQQDNDKQGFAEAGNGIRIDGSYIRNDPNDAMQPDSPERESTWVNQLSAQTKNISSSATRYYLLGNEPGRWHDIHRDIHPEGTHAEELASRSIALATMIHSVDPAAKVVAPEEWAPVGTRDDGYDQQLREIQSSAATDRATQLGGGDFFPWLLAKWKQAGHPVDIIGLHYYPQHGEYGNDVSEAMQLQRNRSTRGLWDPSYHDIDWMPSNSALIPSMRTIIDTYYDAGTPMAITEYSWGAEGHMNGATAQADILGIFGREGLAAATRWIVPPSGSPAYLAMKMFRNYDGQGSGFGETSISAITADVDRVSSFAAQRQDGALTVLVVNKQLHEAAASQISLAGVNSSGAFDAVTLADGKLSQVPAQGYQNGSFLVVLPPQSVTLFVVHPNAR